MFAIFNDEGAVSGDDFVSVAEAQAFMDARPGEYEDCHVAEACHDHPEHERESCEECNAEDDEDDEDEEDSDR
jgi:hypothetical protein